jgi:hypothetical protein
MNRRNHSEKKNSINPKTMKLHYFCLFCVLVSVVLGSGCRQDTSQEQFQFQKLDRGTYEITVADCRKGGKPIFVKAGSNESNYLDIFNNLRKSRSGPSQKLDTEKIVKIRFSNGSEETFVLYTDNWWHHGDSWYHE